MISLAILCALVYTLSCIKEYATTERPIKQVVGMSVTFVLSVFGLMYFGIL